MFQIDRIVEIVGEDRVKKNEPMANHTTFRIGGPAAYFVLPETAEQLSACIKYMVSCGGKWYIIGNGSNLLVSDEGIDAVVFSTHSVSESDMHRIRVVSREASPEQYTSLLKEYAVSPEETEGKTLVCAGAGVMLSALAGKVASEGLAGFAFAGGIPGTMGGAVVMNAGAYGGEIKDVIVAAKVLDAQGEIHIMSRDELQLSYRHSVVQEKDMIVVEALFAFEAGDEQEIRSQMQEFNERRREKQPLEYGSAGSTFKRPEGYFAGKLIEDAGLKGYRVGDVMVSEKHCGFVVNVGNGTCEQADRVIDHVRKTVQDVYGVTLETEVKRIP
ncbi:MAG: UDP-N-acetylmuramate dehydrogenase [Lachnospiraceae bacterium]|nr:UDP-N-acetylmuramate dehydrogenase [Lachnospiraceae bacterium]